MKRVMLGFLFMLSIAASAQTITVRSDQHTDADFSNYKTFYWASQVDSKLDEGLYFLNDLVLKAQIRDAVQSEMMGLGYELNESNPDLIVNFRVFDKPTKLKGLQSYGPDYWGGDYRVTYDTASYDVDAGTLLINLIDREEGAIVWHGFASGLINNDQFIKDEVKIHEAVNLIFEDFNKRAREYTKK